MQARLKTRINNKRRDMEQDLQSTKVWLEESATISKAVWDKFCATNEERLRKLEASNQRREAVGKLAEIKELLMACQDALRYEDSWNAEDFQMLITKALKLCEGKS